MLTCRELTERVDAHVDGSLPWWRRLEIRLHLLMCDRCRTFVRQYRRVVGLVAFIPDDASDEQVEQVLDVIERAGRSRTKD